MIKVKLSWVFIQSLKAWLDILKNETISFAKKRDAFVYKELIKNMFSWATTPSIAYNRKIWKDIASSFVFLRENGQLWSASLMINSLRVQNIMEFQSLFQK